VGVGLGFTLMNSINGNQRFSGGSKTQQRLVLDFEG
jgi:hypothetical protein